MNNNTFFLAGHLDKVREVLMGEMGDRAGELEDGDLPQVAVMGDKVVFSFQPYQIGSYADGISHFVIDKEKLRKHIQKSRYW